MVITGDQFSFNKALATIVGTLISGAIIGTIATILTSNASIAKFEAVHETQAQAAAFVSADIIELKKTDREHGEQIHGVMIDVATRLSRIEAALGIE